MSKPAISGIIDNDLCIACGSCVSVCPRANLIADYNTESGTVQAKILSNDVCLSCPAPCDKVCPSIEVNLPQLAMQLHRQTVEIDREGPAIGRYVGFSSQFQHNKVSSSGGIIRQTLSYYLQEGYNVVCLGREGDEFIPTLITNGNELNNVPGSIYHSISFFGAIDTIRSSDKKVVLVTIPCHLEGLAKYAQETNWDIYDKVHLVLGIICGWMYTRHSLEAFAQYKNIPGKVKKAEYRGEDRVGQLKLKVEDVVHLYSRRKFADTTEKVDYRACFSKSANLLRCRLCENHVNVLADISVGDAWLERNPKDKLSVIVTRTSKGEQAIQEMKSKNLISIETGLETDIIESQSTNLVLGKDARKFSRYLTDKGLPVVKFHFSKPDADEIKKSNLKYSYEMSMRVALRTGRYKLFRWMYVLLMFTRQVRGLVKKQGDS